MPPNFRFTPKHSKFALRLSPNLSTHLRIPTCATPNSCLTPKLSILVSPYDFQLTSRLPTPNSYPRNFQFSFHPTTFNSPQGSQLPTPTPETLDLPLGLPPDLPTPIRPPNFRFTPNLHMSESCLNL